MNSNEELMGRVSRIAGPFFDAISPPDSPTTSFPKPFIMALTANETGQWLIHNTDVPHRFEAGIYEPLLLVQQGHDPRYGSLTTAMLQPLSDEQLRDYSSSWGLTQILGYECLAWKCPLSELQNPQTHYKWTLRLLDEFQQQFWLDPEVDFEGFFRCWNGGKPTAKTHDPFYVSNGMARLDTYRQLFGG